MKCYYSRATVCKYLAAGDEEQLAERLKSPEFLNEIKDPSNQGGFIPLIYACYQGTVEAVKLLLSKDTVVKPDLPMCLIEDSLGRTALHYAANSADPMIIRALAEHIDKIFASTDLTIEDSDLYAETAILLLQVDREKRTALHALCMPSRKIEYKKLGQDLTTATEIIFSILGRELAQKAFLQEDMFGVSPMMYAMHNDYKEILKAATEFLGLESEEESLPLTTTHPAALQVDYFGYTALQRAVLQENFIDVQALLQSGADPSAANAQDGYRNALHMALRRKTQVREVLQALLVRVRTPTTKCHIEATPLHYAAFHANLEGLKALCEVISVETERMVTESDKTTYNEKVNQIRRQINSQDADRRTALHAAVMGGDKTETVGGENGIRIQVIRYLVVNLKIDTSIVDSNGDTALKLAERRGNTRVINFLTDLIPRTPEEAESSCGNFGQLMNWLFPSYSQERSSENQAANLGGAPVTPVINNRAGL